ncbi:hypothetical protein BVRB_007690 [Beta vulgaris subsp. vulgaris]|uniref:Transposase (putative) gypsy type domain-containing protein n=1 Tax=Beta vulgaris subsp. vulgaris TaxID=3555 RepID=A0A0J8B6U6_BETVV|nr:hypothetical protein BVRB_007690 [Beta vulgaris subsp. vulgaris]
MVSVAFECMDPAKVLDALPYSSDGSSVLSGGEGELDNPPHLVTIARPRAVRSYLDDLLDNQVVRVMEESNESNNLTASTGGRSEEDNLPKGIAHFHNRGPFMDFLSENLRFLESSYFIRHPYALYIPEPVETVCTPPTGCIAIYKAYLEVGLRFPIDPFITEVLDSYGLALCQLMPNSVGSMVGFLAICKMMGTRPSLILWRNMMKLVVVSSRSNGEGWWSFQVRFPYKVVGTMPSNNHHFRTEFLYVYRAEPWDFPVVHLAEGPNLGMNRSVPPMSKEEARVAIYCQCLTILERGDKKQVPQYWNPAVDDLSNEHFLSIMGLSPAYPSGRNFVCLRPSTCLYF